MRDASTLLRGRRSPVRMIMPDSASDQYRRGPLVGKVWKWQETIPITYQLLGTHARGVPAAGGAAPGDVPGGGDDAACPSGRSDEPACRLADAELGARRAELFVFNTDVLLYAYPADDEDADDPAVRARLDAVLVAAAERCAFFERTLSRTRADSDISRAHAAAPQPVPVTPETAELTRLALGYGAASEGLFDITMGTITSLWDFHTGRVPSKLELARALEHVGAERIRVREEPADPSAPAGRAASASRPTLSITDPKTVLDLGGIAKGYIADDLARILVEHGVERYVLNLGGNVLVGGGAPRRARRPAAPPCGRPVAHRHRQPLRRGPSSGAC